MNLSKIIKSPEEFEQLQDMLAQDAKSDDAEAIFMGDDPESFPCLVKIEESSGGSHTFFLDEDFDGEIEDMEELEANSEKIEQNLCFYQFTIITQKEIKELLEV